MQPSRGGWRRSCRHGRCPFPRLRGTSCRAAAQGSSRPSLPGRRRPSRRASSFSNRARCATSQVPFCGPLALLLLLRCDRGLECCERAFPVRVGLLELECSLELLELPALRLLVDVGNREVRIAARRLRAARFLRLYFRLRRGGLLLR